MKTTLALRQQRRLRIFAWLAAGVVAASTLMAQTVVPRIQSEISSAELVPLRGSRPPLALPQFDAGAVPANTRLVGMSILFNRSAAQQADLVALLAAQQNPASPLFHHWLTPDQFAARFGMTQADLDKVENWLQQQGFSVDWVARSRTMLRFSGTAAQAEQAFSTQLHYYNVAGARHIAPSADLSIPAALAPVVLAVHNLDNFRPTAQIVPNKIQSRAAFTSGQTGSVFFAPGDVATMYDVKPLYSGGYNGAGQSIAVMGQSAISVTDIENFQNAAGLPVKDPTMVLVPATGGAAFYSGDQAESDLDVEWSGALSPGAQIFFVYTGSSSTSNGVFDSIEYAVDERIANILSASYGACEPTLGTFSMESVFQQAAAQGQTIIAASGDAGSTACYVSPTTTSPTQTIQQELAVNYPASSPYVTGIGGTEITPADSTTSSGYWAAASGGNDLTTSLIKYIPEIAWNDDSNNNGLSATGGGASSLFAKPSWQTALTPADNARDVPDISLYASPGTSTGVPGYLYCTSDQSNWSSGQQASCNSGFRDSSSNLLTVAGGTSFGTPIFAGMLALINQEKGYISGSGNVNSMLYTLANNGGSYSAGTIFHDITTGNNECTAGSQYCSTSSGSTTHYVTATGYDQVTGLGSIDVANLGTAWTASGSTLIGTTTAISAVNGSPAANINDTFTITVAAASGSTTPTGNVKLSIDGGGTTYSSSGTTANVALTASNTPGTATATFQTSFSTAGLHQIVAYYGGDTNFASSSGVVTVSVGGTSSGTGTFQMTSSPATLTVSQGNSGTETLTITPAGGYTGTVQLTLGTSNDSALTNLCYGFTTTTGSVTVTGASPVTTQLTLDTQPSDCGLSVPGKGSSQLRRLGKSTAAQNHPINPLPASIAFAGLLLVGFLGRHSRKFATLAGLVVLLAAGMALTACNGVGNSYYNNGGYGTTPPPPTGTYTMYVTGQDSASASIPAATTQFTFVIQ